MGKIYSNLFAYIFCTNALIRTAKWPKVIGLVSILRQKTKKIRHFYILDSRHPLHFKSLLITFAYLSKVAALKNCTATHHLKSL